MALVLKDRVKETTATTGTGTVTLAGAVSGFQSFAAIGDGNQTYYVISDAATGDWEVGIGTYTASGTTLSRTTVLSSSNAGSLVPFAAGTKDVFVSYPSSRSVYLDTAGSAVTVLDIGTLGTSTANITTANITAGTITTTPTNNTDIVNKQYADAIASGIHFHEAVNYATATALPACTYSNGTGGVGATLTGNVNGALTVDGYTFTSPADDGMRILIKDQASGLQNGVYTLTQAGNSSPGAPFILTRATDFNTVGTGVNQIDEGDFFLVTGGTVNANTAWVQQTPPPIIIGSTAIVFQQFAAPITYTAGTGLSESPSYTFNIATTGVTAATYGSASSVPVITVNAQGQATLVVDTPIAISGSAVSGSISGQAGSVANALTAGTYLTSGGTYDGSAARTFAVDATSANTASKVVARDASGNFSAGTITATLSGAATSATTATNIAGGAANQIPYQTGAGATSFTVAPSASNQVLNWNGSAYTWSAGTISGVPLGSNLNTLTLGTSGTGLSGSTTYNGSGAATFTVTSNATSANTASTIVARDGSGNFSAGTITASLSGTATQVSNAVTFNNGGAGGASGSTFNGSGALTVSYNTIGAPSTTGTNASGTWGINITGSAGSAGASSSVSATTSTGIQSSFITTINTTTPGLTTYGIAFSGSAAADNAQGITWGWSGTSAQAGIYVQSSGAYGTKMYFGTTNSFATGSKTSMSIDHDGVIQVPRSYLQSDSSLRAPIFYDSNDTGYYVDPNSNSRLSSISVPAGSPGFVNAARGSYFGYSSGYGTIIYGATSGNVTPCFNVDPIANPSGSFNGAGGEVMFRNGVQFISPNSSNNGYNNYFVLQDGYLAANNSLRAPIFYDSNNTGYYVDPASTSNLFGPITVSGPNSGSSPLLNLLPSGNGSFQRGVRMLNSGMVGGDSLMYAVGQADGSKNMGQFYFYYAGSGSNSNRVSMGLHSVDDILNIFGTGNTSFGTTTDSGFRLNISGTGYATSDFRAPIFYDSNNTGYYVDPAGLSNINNLLTQVAVSNNVNGLRNVNPGGGSYVTTASTVSGAIRITLPQTVFPMIRFTVRVYTYDNLAFDIYCGGHTSSGFWYNTFAYMGTQNRSALNVRFTYGGGNVYVYIGELGTSWSYPQVFITDVQVGYTNYEYDRWDDGWNITFDASSYQSISSTHTVYPPTSSSNNTNAAYASILYDANNTGYYVDPNNVSYLYGLTLAGGSYFRPNNWIQLEGDYGIYSSVYNSAHFLANISSSYGQWRIIGSRNGWAGIYDTYSAVNGIMYDGSGNGGVYREANGRWYLYYHLGNDCMGIGTASTSSTYSLYLNKGVYAQSRIDATIFYDNNNTAYYGDFASNSVFSNLGLGGVTPDLRLSVSGDSHMSGILYMGGTAGSYNSWGSRTYASGGVWYNNASSVEFNNFGYGSTWTFTLGGGNAISSGSMRAPIFYDSNDTSYYVDPAGSSYLSGPTYIRAGHSTTRIQLYYNHDNNPNSSNAGYLTLWASEPGITYPYTGIGGNINVGGQYYGRQSSGQTYGVYLRFDTGAGQSQFWSTTGSPGSIGGQGTLQWYVDAGGNTVATGNVTAYSDERLKKDWADLPDDFIERLADIKHGTYTRTDQSIRQVGVSAQSLQRLLPEAVLDGDYLSVAYGNAALAACVELAKSVVALRAELNALRAQKGA